MSGGAGSKKRKAIDDGEKEEKYPGFIHGIYLDSEAQDLIVKLFKACDTTSDGHLTKEDFQSFDQYKSQANFAKWLELRDKFDEDADSSITLSEFRSGFKKLALDKPAMLGALPPAETPLRDWLIEIEHRVNIAVKELCQEMFMWLNS